MGNLLPGMNTGIRSSAANDFELASEKNKFPFDKTIENTHQMQEGDPKVTDFPCIFLVQVYYLLLRQNKDIFNNYEVSVQ